jgi:hypothetical protein
MYPTWRRGVVDGVVIVDRQAQQALAVTRRRDLAVADDPPEATGRDQHEPGAVGERELQRLRHAVVRWFADRGQAEAVTVERERGRAIGDRKADDDGSRWHVQLLWMAGG